MRRSQRLIAAAVLAAISVALAGCSGGGFDPTDMMDWFDTKKKLPGERRPVFPEGVPGVEQGVPRDMYKGAHQQEPPPPPVAEAPPPAPEPRNPPARSVAREADPFPKPVDSASPPPRMKKPKRRSTTVPDADGQPAQAPAPQRQQQAAPPPQAAPQQQQSTTPFPAPLPSGGFSR